MENFLREEEIDTVKILVATDCHLGYMEKDEVRRHDSFQAFEEICSIAEKKQAKIISLLHLAFTNLLVSLGGNNMPFLSYLFLYLVPIIYDPSRKKGVKTKYEILLESSKYLSLIDFQFGSRWTLCFSVVIYFTRISLPGQHWWKPLRFSVVIVSMIDLCNSKLLVTRQWTLLTCNNHLSELC